MHKIYSIGHSNHPIQTFMGLLSSHGIQTLVDVRSRPKSRWGQFNRSQLALSLERAGIEYLHLGTQLGGDIPDSLSYSDVVGSVSFSLGLDLLVSRALRRPTVMMCSEHDPVQCHRFLLISRALRDRRWDVEHIMRNGSIVSDSELQLRLLVNHRRRESGATLEFAFKHQERQVRFG